MDAISTLAHYVAEFRIDTIRNEIVSHAKLVLLDTLGAIIAGSQCIPIPDLVRMEREKGCSGDATVLGYNLKLDVYRSALINGTAGVSLEMDEGNQYAKGHPASHIVPATLAWAEYNGNTGKSFLEGIIIGYEVAARLGAAISLLPDVHSHGTWGTIGAAAVVAKLRNFPPDKIKESINIAATLMPVTQWQAAIEGATVRNLYTGFGEQTAILATDYVMAGFKAPSDAVKTTFGSILSKDFSEQVITHRLNSDFQITKNYFKMYSCCRYNHAALDCLLELLKKHPGIESGKIEKIIVETYNLAAQLGNKEPHNMLASKFSIPFALATCIKHGNADIDAFTEDTVADPITMALAKLVEVKESEEFTEMLPAKRPARVTIYLRNGEMYTCTVYTSKGGYDNPYPQSLLEDKFYNLTSGILGLEQSKKLYNACTTIDESMDIRDLTSCCRPGL